LLNASFGAAPNAANALLLDQASPLSSLRSIAPTG
jgi:hypothetical protein